MIGRDTVRWVVRLAISALSLVGAVRGAHAQIATDGTAGPAVDLGAGDVTVGEDLGTRSGANLFHSFARFHVAEGAAVTFTGSDDLAHIISRVTGGEVTRIDGVLRSTPPNADFWLINPSGVTVGAGGAIDVPAGLHIATSDAIVFADGASFSAVDPAGSILTIAPPESFGFIDAASALTFESRTADDAVTVAAADAINLQSGDIVFGAGHQLVLTGGERDAVTIGAVGDLEIDGVRLTTSTDDASAAGSIVLDAGRSVTVQNSALSALGQGGGNAGSIHVRAGADVAVGGTDTRWSVRADDVGDAGDIRIVAGGDITVRDDTPARGGFFRDGLRLQSGTFGEGRAGDITLEAGGDVDLSGANAQFDASTDGSGPGGGVVIEAVGEVRAQTIEFLAQSFGSPFLIDTPGAAGEVRVTAGGPLVFDGVSIVTSVVGADVAAEAGDVTLRSGASATLRGSSLRTGSGGASAGDVRIETAGDLTLNGSFLDLSASAPVGGDFNAVVGGALLASGLNINTVAGQLNGAIMIDVAGGAAINGSSLRTGDAGFAVGGDLRVDAAELVLIDSFLFARGRTGGLLSLSATGALRIQNTSLNTGSSSGLFRSFVGDRANDVRITAGGDIDLIGADITTFNDGVAALSPIAPEPGRIDVDAGGALRVELSNVQASGFGNAGGGTIRLASTGVMQVSGVSIGANAQDEGASGDILLDAGGDLIVEAREGVPTEIFNFAGLSTSGPGGVGAIRLVSDGSIQVDGSTALSSNNGGRGDGGDILLESAVDIRFGGALFADGLGEGSAGNVLFQAGEDILLSPFASVQASLGPAASGAGGSVTMTAGGDIGFEFGARVFSDTEGFGDAGSINLTAGDGVSLIEGAITAGSSGSGDAGGIAIEARHVLLQNADVTVSATGGGTPGGVRISGDESVTLTNFANVSSTGVLTTANLDRDFGGGIAITSLNGRVSVEDSRISLSRENATGGGELGSNITPPPGLTGVLLLSGREVVGRGGYTINAEGVAGAEGGTLNISADELLRLEGPTPGSRRPEVTVRTTGDLPGGEIRLQSPRVELLGVDIIADTAAFGPVDRNAVIDGGDVTIAARSVLIDGSVRQAGERRPRISSLTATAATGGTIVLGGMDGPGTLEDVTVRDYALIASTVGPADGGDILVNTSGAITIDDAQVTSATGLSTLGDAAVVVESATGAAGDVFLNGGDISIVNASAIDVSSASPAVSASSGRVLVNARGDLTVADSSITAATNASAAGSEEEASAGTLFFGVGGLGRLSDAVISSSVLEGGGFGGVVTINGAVTGLSTPSNVADLGSLGPPPILVVENTAITARADENAGGLINLTFDALIRDPLSVFDATSNAGPRLDGLVRTSSPETDLSGALKPLDSAVAAPLTLGLGPCAALEGNALIVGSAGGVPVSSRGLLPLFAAKPAPSRDAVHPVWSTACVVAADDPKLIR